MNSVLQLKGRFESRKANPPNGPSYPVGLHIQAEDLVPLCDQLKEFLGQNGTDTEYIAIKNGQE